MPVYGVFMVANLSFNDAMFMTFAAIDRTRRKNNKSSLDHSSLRNQENIRGPTVGGGGGGK